MSSARLRTNFTSDLDPLVSWTAFSSEICQHRGWPNFRRRRCCCVAEQNGIFYPRNWEKGTKGKRWQSNGGQIRSALRFKTPIGCRIVEFCLEEMPLSGVVRLPPLHLPVSFLFFPPQRGHNGMVVVARVLRAVTKVTADVVQRTLTVLTSSSESPRTTPWQIIHSIDRS